MVKKIIVFTLSILASLSAGAIGSLATMPNIPTWYAALEKPLLNPPNWIFGPVWTTLYVCIGIALALVILHKADTKKRAYAWFGTQLVLNTLWSITFFGLQQPWLAAVIIIALTGSIIMTMRYFRRLIPVAFWLLVPYLAWVSFATYLNIGIAILN